MSTQTERYSHRNQNSEDTLPWSWIMNMLGSRYSTNTTKNVNSPLVFIIIHKIYIIVRESVSHLSGLFLHHPKAFSTWEQCTASFTFTHRLVSFYHTLGLGAKITYFYSNRQCYNNCFDSICNACKRELQMINIT